MFVRTLLGDIAPEQMGLTYSHEHVVIEASFPTLQNAGLLLNDVDKISAELREFYESGGRTLVDTMPADAGRNVLKLAEISRRTGVHIIAPTGIHLELYYPPNHWRYHLDEDQITRLFIEDIEKGIDRLDYGSPVVERTPYCAGVVKLATGDGPITPHQEKIFHCVVNTHRETGVPILTHTNNGLQALEQAELFARLGADLRHVVLSHVDRNQDLGYHRAIFQTGVRVEYDSAFRWKQGQENNTYRLLDTFLPEFPDQITCGMDMARNTYWKSYGGKPGLTFLITTFKTELIRRGLGKYWDLIFYKNPQSLYTFNCL